MRYFSFLMFLMLGVYAFAQKDVTQFLGIPVDGTKTEMVQKLKAKGFKYNSTYDWLEGEFNGGKVTLRIVTYNNKVWRIVVSDKWATDEANIKIRFNNLCRQFAKNEKYLPLKGEPELLEEERIGYEMMVNNKRYESAYYQSPKDLITLSEEEKSLALTEGGLRDAPWDSLTFEEQKEQVSAWIDYAEDKYWSKKSVWFMIAKDANDYRIVIYYDNEYNCANGEDL